MVSEKNVRTKIRYKLHKNMHKNFKIAESKFNYIKSKNWNSYVKTHRERWVHAKNHTKCLWEKKTEIQRIKFSIFS